jgi:phage repressor protein C with HTH and peptisase S24 domain
MTYALALADVRADNPVTLPRSARLKLRREALGLTQGELATLADVHVSTVVRLEKNRNVESATLDAIDAALTQAERDQPRHRGTGELNEPEVEDFDRDIERGYRHHDVPVVGDAEASSNGFIAWDSEGIVGAQVEQWVSRSFSDGDPRAYALRVRGDSMVPRYFPGEIIIAQPMLPVRDGDFACVILTSGERLVKRVFRKDATWLLKSLNEDYPERLVAHDEIQAIHRIKHSITT